jgi:hypothetical protein
MKQKDLKTEQNNTGLHRMYTMKTNCNRCYSESTQKRIQKKIQDRQSTYNVTLRRVRVTTVAVQEQ